MLQWKKDRREGYHTQVEDVQKTAQVKEEELEELKRQQEKLRYKKEKEAHLITEAMIERTTDPLTVTARKCAQQKVSP